MKKIIAVILAIVLCFGFSVSAFAAGSPQSPSDPGSSTTPSEPVQKVTYDEAKDANGKSLTLIQKDLLNSNQTAKEISNAATVDEFIDNVGVGLSVKRVMDSYGVSDAKLVIKAKLDISVSSGTPAFPLTVTIPVDGVKPSDAVVVIHRATSGYEVVSAKVVSTGKVEAVFSSLSPVIVLVAERSYKSYADCPRTDECVFSAYSDLDPARWYHDSIHYCLDKGYMSGYGKGLFGPFDTVSRAMIVTILYNLEGKPAVAEKSSYTDVAEGKWYADAIAWAEDKGIVGGIGKGLFAPEDDITREELAAIFCSYAKFKGYNVSARAELDGYTDVAKISKWAVDSFKWAKAVSLVSGVGNGLLAPRETATRAEAATIIRIFCEKIAK